jgi:hypothetical protein
VSFLHRYSKSIIPVTLVRLRGVISDRDDQHEENLKLHNCRVLETGEKEMLNERRGQAEEAFDKKIEETVEREFDKMPSAKKEQLANELVNGKLDVAVERR